MTLERLPRMFLHLGNVEYIDHAQIWLNYQYLYYFYFISLFFEKNQVKFCRYQKCVYLCSVKMD